MTFRILVLLALLLDVRGFAAENSSAAGEPALVFAGYANFAGGPVFVIHDPATDESSPWTGLAQTWHGYTFVKFEPKGEKLTLRKDAKELTLALKSSKIVEAYLRPRLVKGTYAIVDNRVVYSADAEFSVGEGLIISAAEGVITANPEQTILSGTLRIRQPDGRVLTARDAVFGINGGKAHMTVQGGITLGPLQAESGEKKP